MKLTIKATARFKKDLKLIAKRGYDIQLLYEVVDLLVNEKELPSKYADHDLIGNDNGYRECHIKPDWLLIYQIIDNELILLLSRTGRHCDLF